MAAITVKYEATMPDGSKKIFCCGPALLQSNVIAFHAISDAEYRVCCHTGAILRSAVLEAEREAYDYEALYEALGQMLGDKRR